MNYGLIKVLDSSILVMSNSSMRHNQARDHAGAIYVEDSKARLTNTKLSHNKAKVAAGAIYVVNSVVHLLNTNFYDNKAVRAGGAIFAYNSSLWIAHSSFKHNQIPSRDSNSNTSKFGFGGAIYFKSSSVVVMHNVNFTHNSADDGAAI